MSCPLTACRICTGCVHSDHGACRKQVICPDDGMTRECGCCGDVAIAERAS
jgi:hypothetical protein